jgi:hypothetical protein
MKVYISNHAIDRFIERIACLSRKEAAQLLHRAALSFPSLPGLYEPSQELRVEVSGFSFWIAVAPPPKEGLWPMVATVYPDSRQKIKQAKTRQHARREALRAKTDESEIEQERTNIKKLKKTRAQLLRESREAEGDDAR